MTALQLFFNFLPERTKPKHPDHAIEVGNEVLPMTCKKNARARHYLVYLRSDRSVSVTIPRYGTKTEALQFAHSKREWLVRQLRKLDAQIITPQKWSEGTEILFRGHTVTLGIENTEKEWLLTMADQSFPVQTPPDDFRPLVEAHLRKLAREEISRRAWELAKQYQSPIKKFTVRNQSSRWGSCSPSGTISLNWRLIQAPPFVRDYVIQHELMHLKEMNHSKKFWALVAKVCPNFKEAEKWLKLNAARLGL